MQVIVYDPLYETRRVFVPTHGSFKQSSDGVSVLYAKHSEF